MRQWRENFPGSLYKRKCSRSAPNLEIVSDAPSHSSNYCMKREVLEYDAETRSERLLAETILNRAAKIEDVLGISDVLVEDLTLNPD